MSGPRRRLGVAVGVLIMTVIAGALLVASRSGSGGLRLTAADPAEATYRYEIPPGTGDRIDAGEQVAILPGTLTVRVGEVLQVVNDDDRGHVVGPFFVGAGQTLTQRFQSPGEIIGTCSVHTDGQFRIEVLP